MNNALVANDSAGKMSGADERPVPVLVLSGTLGSGKTTVVNAMLQQQLIPDDWNVVLIENDIGRANQDYARINLPDARKIPLTSGCICCRSLGQLKVELLRLEGLPPSAQPDLILIETTGIAHPDQIKNELRSLQIPSVLAVTVDVAHFEDNRRLNLIDRGLAAADVLVLTWWDGIVSPEALNDPKLDSIRSYIDARELEAIALGAKRAPAERIYFKPPSKRDGDTGDARFIGAVDKRLLLPAAEDLQHRPLQEFSQGHATLKARTLQLRTGVTVDELLGALGPFRSSGGSVIRIKSAAFDMVQNEICGAEGGVILSGPVNIITSPAFDLGLVKDLIEEGVAEDEEQAQKQSLEAAMRRLIDLTARHPRNPVLNNSIQMDFDEDEAYDYADRAGVPGELRSAFYRVAIEARSKALQAILSSEWADHTDLPYYQWRMGSQGVWWLQNREQELRDNGSFEQFRDAKPASMYFAGLVNIVQSSQVEEIKRASVPWLRTMIDALSEELGDRGEAVERGRLAFTHCRDLDRTGSWKLLWNEIEQILQRGQL